MGRLLRALARCSLAWPVLAVLLMAAPRPVRAADDSPELEATQTAHYAFAWSPGLEGFARTLVDDAEAQHARIYAQLGAEAPAGRTRVTILRDEQAMLAFARSHYGGRPPEWAAGLAYPAQRAILLHVGVGPDQLETTFRHELSHVALGDLSADRVPRWFSEGVAIRQSEGLSLQRAWLLTEAATMNALLPLRDLSAGFPASGARAGVAYAEAVHFVGYLEGEFGAARFRDLLGRLRDGDEDFATATESAFGRPLGAIEADWQAALKVRWGWLPVIFGSTTLWSLGALVLVLAWRRRRRQKAQRLDVMRSHEAVDMADDIEVAHELEAPRRLHDPYDGRPPTIH